MASVCNDIARELIGIPWRRAGTDFRPLVGGADCRTLVFEFLRRIGSPARDPWSVAGVQELWARGATVAEALPGEWQSAAFPLEVGDIGATRGGRHIVVLAAPGLVLHSDDAGGSCLLPMARLRVSAWWRWRQ